MVKLKKIEVYLCGIVLLIIDQVTKLIIIKNIFKMPIVVVKGFLKFTYCENRGVAFSLGSGNVYIFIVLNIIIICGLIVYFEKNKSQFNMISKIAISMIIAGGTGNLLDRIFRGFVVDFIDVSEFVDFAIFNIADIFIVIGVFVIAVSILMKTSH